MRAAADAALYDFRMDKIASLPWYYFPHLAPHYDALWRHVARELRGAGVEGVPAALADPMAYRAHWGDDDRLLLTQCCGYHVATGAQDLQVVAAPHFEIEGVAPGEYRSLIVMNKKSTARTLSDFKQGCAVFNENQSFSGYTAMLCTIPPQFQGDQFFSELTPAGTHHEAMKLIAAGEADVAAIDAVTYELLTSYDSELAANLRWIEQTEPAEAPPFVTSRRLPERDVNALRDALVGVSRSREPSVRDALKALRIRAIVDATNEDYYPMAEQIRDVEAAYSWA